MRNGLLSVCVGIQVYFIDFSFIIEHIDHIYEYVYRMREATFISVSLIYRRKKKIAIQVNIDSIHYPQ